MIGTLRAVFLLSDDLKGQRVVHFNQVTCFQNTLRIRRFIYHNFFSPNVLAQMFVFNLSTVSLGKSMYHSAFALVVATIEKHSLSFH